MSATIPVGASPAEVAITPDGRRAYVSNTDSDSVSVIDAANRTVLGDQIPVGDGPCALAVAPDGDLLYVVNGQSNTVSVLDLG